jgi:hypothetical protein
MKMRPLRITLAFLSLTVILFLASGCSKDEAQPTPEELITKSWIHTDLLATIGGVSQSVYADQYNACEQDNIYSFSADGTFSVTEGSLKCDPSDPDVFTTGTWQLLENGKKIIIDTIDEDPYTLDIDELTATSMKGSIIETSNGISVKVTFVYTSK